MGKHSRSTNNLTTEKALKMPNNWTNSILFLPIILPFVFDSISKISPVFRHKTTIYCVERWRNIPYIVV